MAVCLNIPNFVFVYIDLMIFRNTISKISTEDCEEGEIKVLRVGHQSSDDNVSDLSLLDN